MTAEQTQALIALTVTFGLLALMILPSVLGIVRERRIDRQLGEAREAREAQEAREAREARQDREDEEVREEAQKSSSRSTVPSTATWYADGRRSKKLVSS
ncbi:hypothetical protein SUDANB58_03915 [Streptomyces sp. enrichment culture]|uniref:hypothetical protein n=1 Tax=Streptomyces sp. enrichment culture TaxID=1795815 RepID=UPI003F549117